MAQGFHQGFDQGFHQGWKFHPTFPSSLVFAMKGLRPSGSAPLPIILYLKQFGARAKKWSTPPILAASENNTDLILRSLPTGPRIARPNDKLRKLLEGWTRRRCLRPSFETRARARSSG